ncbi:carbon-monoxide dehydrogenase medium subunit [Tamaricihabitans halophyticus]|uniref:Carbon-monoxide dehydrogenase medium subunit n=1 Tax=Tamaricihabitans halophyticus TaxID=1262583 RepID=A0A4V2SUT3_9PSEU|nr:FAD binding domain-containing protein [Tamaricihabitans halophyticus]TCP55326.1 carbon-monoxide dehydrogenase medium subunit [Tamaricihabitans halophyticus]
MKPAAIDYARPASVADALSIMESDVEAKVLAGGQSLLAVMNFRLARPTQLIDIGSLAELNRIFDDDGSLLIGALRCHRDLETDPLVRDRLPPLAEAARHIGHIAIRNRGTLGGSIAHADPAAELPALAALLDAEIYVDSRQRGRRVYHAAEFFEARYTTLLEPDELVTWIRFPTLPADAGWGFTEAARRHGDFAIAGAFAVVELTGDRRLRRARAVLFGVTDRPWLIEAVELTGRVAAPDIWREFATAAMAELVDTMEGAYRWRVAAGCLARAFERAAANARAGAHE